MAGSSSYHRMRGSERCEQCSTRQWYEQEGLRFCRNGHQLEGFAAHEAGEDEYNSTGRVTKARKERRSREGVKLEGAAGRRLYLQALQYVLREQVEWLRHTGLELDEAEGAMFEELVKELWGLVCAMPGVMDSIESADQTDGLEVEDLGATSSEADDTDVETRSNGWSDKKGSKLPSLDHTLALCYLACVILRQPVTTADFHGWAQRGEIQYLTALRSLPQDVQNRLPAMYHRAMQVKDHIKPGKLLYTAQELAIALKVHYELKLPPLNYPQILMQQVLNLTLPPEVYLMVRCLIQTLEIMFDYPDHGTRQSRTMDNPEIILLTLLVVSTKLLYPLDGVERPPISDSDPRAKQIDWKEWQKARTQAQDRLLSSGLKPGTEHQVSSNEAISMSDDKLDDFMDWYEKMWIDTNEDDLNAPAAIRREFEPDRTMSASNLSQELTTANSKVIRHGYHALAGHVKYIEPQADPEAVEGTRKRLERDFCPVWRSEADLPENAKYFYQEVADLGNVPLKTLVMAAAQVERWLEVWSAKREKESQEGQILEDGNGKGKTVA